jgi:hypothetical protein
MLRSRLSGPPRCSDAFRPFVVAMPAITLSESLSVTARVTDSCVADDPARDRQREYYGSARIRDGVADCLVQRGSPVMLESAS